jgi:hypothetical protein
MNTEELARLEAFGRRIHRRRNDWPRRLRILRALGGLALLGLLVTALAIGAYRTVRMLGLPDVGDPFGPPAPRPTSTPDSENADILYKLALDSLKSVRKLDDLRGRQLDLRVTWAQADPALRQWVRDNAQASALFRQAAELSGASREPRPTTRRGPLSGADEPYFELRLLARLNASRLEARKDMAAAWPWYRAALAATYDYGRDMEEFGRFHAQGTRTSIAIPINAWAEAPEVNAAMLRQALDDLISLQKRIPSDLSTFEAAYHRLMREIDEGRWSSPRNAAPWTVGFGGYEVPMNLAEPWWWGRRFLDNEPERSRRVIRLAFANWRAQFAQPAELRPKPALKVVVKRDGSSSSIEFFPAGPNAPEAARRMSPHRLAAWFETTDDAMVPLAEFWSTFQAARLREHAGEGALLVHLAEQLYLRERGELPPNLEALVGPYLKSLPDDGSSEVDDGTLPTRRID